MAEWGERKTETAAASDEKRWIYGGLGYPMAPEPPKLVYRVFRQNADNPSEVEYKDIPDPEPGEQPQTARQAFGLEPMPGAEPTPAA